MSSLGSLCTDRSRRRVRSLHHMDNGRLGIGHNVNMESCSHRRGRPRWRVCHHSSHMECRHSGCDSSRSRQSHKTPVNTVSSIHFRLNRHGPDAGHTDMGHNGRRNFRSCQGSRLPPRTRRTSRANWSRQPWHCAARSRMWGNCSASHNEHWDSADTGLRRSIVRTDH
jgi:hypothetical protein